MSAIIVLKNITSEECIMKKFLLPESGNFYKANLHCHTTLSDGNFTPEQVKEHYKSLGYSIVAYTDHDVFLPHPELCDDSFLALNGFEVETNAAHEAGVSFDLVKTCHFCCIALDPETVIQPCWHRKHYLFGNAVNQRELVKFDESQPDYVRSHTSEGITDHMTKVREAGFFVTYNHPTWSIEDYSDYVGFHGMHAMEMFNGSCNAMGYEDYNPRVYDDMLRGGERIYCIGADDNHNSKRWQGTRRSDSGWAWTVIKADKLDYKTVTDAMLAGNFYASEGPEIKELWYEDGYVHIKCSDADRITYISGTRHRGTVLADADGTVNEAVFDVKPHDKYFRLTVTDKSGKHACTNAYFIDTL